MSSERVPSNEIQDDGMRPGFLLLLDAADFAAARHREQRRKGVRMGSSKRTPYINHPIEVARLLCAVGGVADPEILCAALLHDTVEDTGTSPSELRERFGDRVAELVLEMTDDKSLEKRVRKRLQVERAPFSSPDAKLVKLADKICNLSDLEEAPPDWSAERKRDFVEWSIRVVEGLRGTNDALEAHFDELTARLEHLRKAGT